MKRAFLLFVLTCSLLACSKPHAITITNNSELTREKEIVEIDYSDIRKLDIGTDFLLLDERGEEIPYQLTYNNKVIFPVTINAGETAVIKVEKGIPSRFDTIACGAFYPQRKDDLAWENDKSAYRAYGPALQQSGEKAFGYDIWTKSVEHPVVAQRYHNALELGIPYHKDNGDGMDVYTVGPTLGGGTTALLDTAGNLIFPWGFKDYEILDNGPLRFTAKLTYDSGETRLISLDAGEYLNKTDVSYPNPENNVIASGIVIHRQNPEGFELSAAKNYMAYADLTDNANAGNGVIYVGIVTEEADSMINLPLKEPQGDAIGHILALKSYKPGEKYTYYWGSGWSKGFMPDWESWLNYLANFRSRLDSPLSVTVE
ncbi:MAG: DUF4861 domain-containing protein [Muribaculaceae bacterium]|nr:DUF4861 domain-containing protein [Muribaculaceae bacterium]